MMVDISVKFEWNWSLQKLSIWNQKCYNVDNSEDDDDDLDMIHMWPLWFAGDTKNVHFVMKLGILLDFKNYRKLFKIL